MKLRSDFSIVISIAFLIQIRISNLSNVGNTYLNFLIDLVIKINVLLENIIFLINKYSSRIKVFEPFENISKPFPSIYALMISCGFVYKRLSKPVIKGSRVETKENAR